MFLYDLVKISETFNRFFHEYLTLRSKKNSKEKKSHKTYLKRKRESHNSLI